MLRCKDVEYLINLISNRTHQATPLALLEDLKLNGLFNLKGLCHPDLLQLQRDQAIQFRLFYNLTILDLECCVKLRYVFSTSIANGSIPQLQSLFVNFCDEIESVVYKETDGNDDSNIVATDMIVFPKLASVYFRGLKSLISLYRAMDDSDAKLVTFKCINWLPSLKSLKMEMCDKVRVVFDFDGLVIPQLPEKEKTNTTLVAAQLIDPCTDQEEDHLHGIDHRCLGCLPVPPPTRKHKQDQRNDTATQKKSQDDIVNSTRSSHSDVRAEVRSAGARDHGDVGVPDGNDKVLHNLEAVEVSECESVGVILDFGESQGPFPPVLNDLNDLSLRRLPQLMHIWKITKKGLHQLVVTSSFRNLRYIEVWDCGRLRYIFSPSIAKLLVMLESIKVKSCESMQAVISVAKEEEDKPEESAFTTISFPNLRSIDLRNLYNLSCFCDQPNYAVRFPSLESVVLYHCPKLETFVAAATMSAEDTPMLKHVGLDYIEIFEEQGDLNTAIHRNFQAKKEKLKQQAA